MHRIMYANAPSIAVWTQIWIDSQYQWYISPWIDEILPCMPRTATHLQFWTAGKDLDTHLHAHATTHQKHQSKYKSTQVHIFYPCMVTVQITRWSMSRHLWANFWRNCSSNTDTWYELTPRCIMSIHETVNSDTVHSLSRRIVSWRHFSLARWRCNTATRRASCDNGQFMIYCRMNETRCSRWSVIEFSVLYMLTVSVYSLIAKLAVFTYTPVIAHIIPSSVDTALSQSAPQSCSFPHTVHATMSMSIFSHRHTCKSLLLRGSVNGLRSWRHILNKCRRRDAVAFDCEWWCIFGIWRLSI